MTPSFDTSRTSVLEIKDLQPLNSMSCRSRGDQESLTLDVAKLWLRPIDLQICFAIWRLKISSHSTQSETPRSLRATSGLKSGVSLDLGSPKSPMDFGSSKFIELRDDQEPEHVPGFSPRVLDIE